ncbi:MAG: hypothetical protein JKY89_08300 [Immundisolibacteraceae bacterium]|nr:hypothetical protein [Immundisolibacteraceae bacterium]
MQLPLPKVCVTFNADQNRQQIIDQFKELAEVCFLSDLADQDDKTRRDLLLSSNVIFCLQPGAELNTSTVKQMPHLSFVQLLSAGVDHVDFNQFPEATPLACNAGAYSKPIAEHVLAMALALTKKLPQRHQAMREGEFDQMTMTGSLQGKVAGILGFGGIGKESAKFFRAMGMSIQAINSSGTSQPDVDFTGTLNDLEQLMRAADLLLISLPLTHNSENLIGKTQLSWLKPDAMIINVARGEIVDQTALYNHLVDNPDANAAIDAWWVEPFRHGEFKIKHPFLDLPNLLGSPHNSPRSPGADQHSIKQATANIVNFLTAGKVTGLINRQRDRY